MRLEAQTCCRVHIHMGMVHQKSAIILHTCILITIDLLPIHGQIIVHPNIAPYDHLTLTFMATQLYYGWWEECFYHLYDDLYFTHFFVYNQTQKYFVPVKTAFAFGMVSLRNELTKTTIKCSVQHFENA